MTQALAHARFTSSRLTRFLSENAMLADAPVQEDVGQTLGDWLNFRHAIALHSVLNPEPQAPAELPGAVRRAALMSAEALTRHVDKIRAQLEQSIAQGAPAGTGLTRIDMPPAELDEPLDPKTAYAPYRRFHAAHQRQMESAVHNLRSQVRAQLSKKSPALQQLALLDAAFENILSEREAVLLGHVAKQLEKRFAQALKEHIKNQAKLVLGAQDPPKPQTWLMPFRQMLRTALLAELDTRLQPTLGLLEAFQSDTSPEP